MYIPSTLLLLLYPLHYYYLLLLYTHIQPILLENKSDYIRVVTTELNPRIQYKTLPITEYTTAYEIVVKIVRKFAAEEEDKDPHDYYLTEVYI